MDKEQMLTVLLLSAQHHGNISEPDHEVGDLQDIVRLMAGHLTEDQMKQVFEAHRTAQPEFVEDVLAGVANGG